MKRLLMRAILTLVVSSLALGYMEHRPSGPPHAAERQGRQAERPRGEEHQPSTDLIF
jgi:hypothetical protein